MSWAHGIFTTLGLIAGLYLVLFVLAQLQVPNEAIKMIEMLFGAFIVLGSSYWVYVDSERIEISKYEGGFVSGPPMGLAIACALLWIVFLPAYLQKRYLIKNRLTKLKAEFHPNYRKPE